jgi:hypothetical protein
VVDTGYKALLRQDCSDKRPSILGPEFRRYEALTARANVNHPKEQSAKLFARLASCDVTPRDRPVRLAGYASRIAPVATILDPIEISAVLLECSGQRCVIISFDLMIVGSELQNMILAGLRRLGFEPDEIFLMASHTHSAPATDRACARLGIPEAQFVDDLAEAAENLVRTMQSRQPSEISLDVFQGQLNHSINRRRYWPFPTVGRTYGFRLTSMSLAPNPSGSRDERATVALLRSTDDGQVLGAIWHYTCHPTAVVPENAISSDYPGAVRRALRERFGQIPCIFLQGFCGDVRPNIATSRPNVGWRERLRRMARTMVSGPTFASPSAEDWPRWSQSLAAAVCNIARNSPGKTLSPARLQTGSNAIPLGGFFTGSTPDKMLAAQIVRIGEELEIVALSAEVTVEWQRILDQAIPVQPGRIRLYAGYQGALFGYLPTAAQIAEGGYEVEGFQPLFGLSGRFLSDRIAGAVESCVGRAFEDMARAEGPAREPAPAPAP